MGWPQIAYIALTALGVGIHLAKHGEQRRDKYSAWLSMAGAALSIGILYAGGFFA